MILSGVMYISVLKFSTLPMMSISSPTLNLSKSWTLSDHAFILVVAVPSSIVNEP